MGEGAGDALPPAGRVLAVCAHPDDESFGLGGILGTYADRGARVALLCLTRGEASALGGAARDLPAQRSAELRAACEALGVEALSLRDYPDGALADTALGDLADEAVSAIRASRADLVVVFDPGGVTGHPDHRRATCAARVAATRLGTPVWAWYLPWGIIERLSAELGSAFVGPCPDAAEGPVPVDRRRQRVAMAAHESQAASLPVVRRRLELLGDLEHLRLLAPPRGRAEERCDGGH